MKVSYSWDKVKGADPMVLLTDETRKHIDHWVAKFPPDRKRSAMLQALMAAQEQNGGYLTDQLTAAVSKYLGVMTVFAFEVASFYSLLNTKPVGRHEVSVCTNVSCWLRGADELVKHCEEKLGVKVGESTPDGRVYLKQEEECLGACRCAPVMQIDGYYHEFLTPEKIDAAFDELK